MAHGGDPNTCCVETFSDEALYVVDALERAFVRRRNEEWRVGKKEGEDAEQIVEFWCGWVVVQLVRKRWVQGAPHFVQTGGGATEVG